MFIPFFVPFDDSPDLSPASLLCGVASDGFFFFCLPCGSCASDLLGFGFSGDFPETSLLIRMSMRGFDSAGLKILWNASVSTSVPRPRSQWKHKRTNPPLSLLIALILSSLFCLLASISSAVVSAAVLSAIVGSLNLSWVEVLAWPQSFETRRRRSDHVAHVIVRTASLFVWRWTRVECRTCPEPENTRAYRGGKVLAFYYSAQVIFYNTTSNNRDCSVSECPSDPKHLQ